MLEPHDRFSFVFQWGEDLVDGLVCFGCLFVLFMFCFLFFFSSNRHLALSLKNASLHVTRLSVFLSLSLWLVLWEGSVGMESSIGMLIFRAICYSNWAGRAPPPTKTKQKSLFLFFSFLSVAQVSTPSSIQETVEGPPESHSSINESHLLVMLLGSDSALMQCP